MLDCCAAMALSSPSIGLVPVPLVFPINRLFIKLYTFPSTPDCGIAVVAVVETIPKSCCTALGFDDRADSNMPCPSGSVPAALEKPDVDWNSKCPFDGSITIPMDAKELIAELDVVMDALTAAGNWRSKSMASGSPNNGPAVPCVDELPDEGGVYAVSLLIVSINVLYAVIHVCTAFSAPLVSVDNVKVPALAMVCDTCI